MGVVVDQILGLSHRFAELLACPTVTFTFGELHFMGLRPVAQTARVAHQRLNDGFNQFAILPRDIHHKAASGTHARDRAGGPECSRRRGKLRRGGEQDLERVVQVHRAQSVCLCLG